MIDFPKQKTSKFMDQIDLNHVVIKKADLKIDWNPQMSKKRSKGHFTMTSYDIIKKSKNEKFPTDVKTFQYKNSDEDLGTYSFDVTSAVKRWSKDLKSKMRQLMLQRSSIKIKTPNFAQELELLPLGNVSQAKLLIYSQDLQYEVVKREARR